MKHVLKVMPLLGLMLAARPGSTQPSGDEAGFDFRGGDYSVVAPDPDVATAAITGTPSWCQGVKLTEQKEPRSIGMFIKAGYTHNIVEAARFICERVATNATWQKEAGYILQTWMNAGHFTQAQAEASLTARVQKEPFAADREALCKRLEVSPEASGEVLVFADAHKVFFGCGGKDPLWMDPSESRSAVGFYLDAAPKPETEMLRMYYLINRVAAPWGVELPSRDADKNRRLLAYAMAQSDFAALEQGVVEQQLKTAPFDNAYARTIALETLYRLKAEQVTYEAAVEKLTKGDKDYTHLLREVPKASTAAWDKLVAPWKAELDRSYAFERKLSEPSREAVKGCSVELTKDAAKLLRSYNKHTYQELVDKIAADPVARLLVGRLAVCDGIEHIDGISGALASLVTNRESRGPRTAMYADMTLAIVQVRKDRPKLLLENPSYGVAGDYPPSLVKLYDNVMTGSMYDKPEEVYDKGYVKSVKKVSSGLEITFKRDKISFAHYDCADDTHHPTGVNQATGHVEYSRNCVATGKMDSQDNTPKPVTIAEGGATGVKPGVVVTCGTITSSGANAYVFYVRSSPKTDKIETFLSIPL